MKQSMFKSAVCALALLCTLSTQAAVKYWDSNGTTTGAGTAPGGTWGTSAFWSTSSAGTATPGAWTAGDIAVFSAGTDATGSAAVVLNGTQTCGGITNEEGTVVFSSGTAAMGTGIITIKSGAKLSVDSGTGRLTASSGAVMVLDGGTYENTITGANGSFVPSSMVIVVTANGGTLSYTASGVLNIIQTGTPGTSISGPGSITKEGAGILAVGVASTYGGSTTVNNGVLRARNVNDVLPTGTDLIVNSPGSFDCNNLRVTVKSLSGNGTVTATTSTAGTLKVNGSTTPAAFSGVMSGNGSLSHSGSGTLTLSGVNTYTGKFTNSAGITTVNSGAKLCGPVCDVIINGGTLNLNNTTQSIEDLSGTGGTINLTTGHILIIDPATSPSFAGTIAGLGAVTKSNLISGATMRTLTLTGPNTYDGNTLVGGGKLAVGSATALGSTSGNTTVVGGAELLFDGSTVNFTCAEPITIAGGGAGDGGAITIQNSASPTLSGAITLSGGGTVSNTVSSSATVVFSNPNSFTSTANETLLLQGGSGAGGGGTVSGIISLGTGGLTKQQGGTWTLTGANSYSGATAINAGKLIVNSPGSLPAASTVTVASGATLAGSGTVGGPTTIQSGGTLAPGTSIGTLTFDSSLALSGTTSMEINKTAASADKIVMSSGTVTLGGTLTVVNLAGTLQLGDSFDLIDGTIAGTFTTLNLPTLAAGLTWDTSQLAPGGNGIIKVVCSSAPPIGTQPTSQIACSGSTANFTVTATAVQSYAWRKRGTGWATGNQWQLNASGANSGFSIADSTANGSGSSLGINTSSKAWSLYANSGDTASAVRGFSAMTVGQTFRIDMDNGTVDNGSVVGFQLRNASDEVVWEFSYTGGAVVDTYQINGVDLSPTIAGTADGLRIAVTLTSASTYSAVVTTPVGGSAQIYTGNLLSPAGGQVITQTRLYNQNAGASPSNDVFFNSISVGAFDDDATAYTTWSDGDNKGNGPLVNGGNIAGATSAALSISSTSAGDAGSYDVVVQNPCGRTISSTVTLTVNPRPTAVASGTATICNGSSTVISAALTGTGPWNVTWSDSVVQNGVATSPATRNVSPSSSTTYSVTALTDANCTATGGDLTGSAAITVNPRPTATVSGTATICNGSSTVISAALTGTGPWNVTWSDSFTQTGVASSPATRNVSPGSAITYTVTALSDANCSATGGDLSGSAAITVNTVTANTTTYSRNADSTLKIYISNLLTNASDTLNQTISFVGVGTDGVNLLSAGGTTLSFNGTFIGYTNSTTPNVNDSITYKVTDTMGCIGLGTIQINVTTGIGVVIIPTATGSSITLTFHGIPGYDYVVQRSDDLSTWVDASGTLTAPADGVVQFTETPPNNPEYYRVRQN